MFIEDREVVIKERMGEVARGHGLETFGFVPIEDFVFNRDFHDACAANRCGKYGTNWSCPPGAGTYDDLVSAIRRFSTGMVVQTVWKLADSFDIDGMLDSGREHNAIFRKIAAGIRPLLTGPSLILSAGSCTLCETCSYVLRKPCRKPDEALGTLEAYGVDVTALVTGCGLKYNNGPNTVSYVGVIMFRG